MKILYEENNKIYLNLSELVRTKYMIPEQYETFGIGGKPEDLKYLSNKNDRYILHIFEEMSEFIEEINNFPLEETKFLYDPSNSNAIMELIDIIEYTGSLLSILFIDEYGKSYIYSDKFSEYKLILPLEELITINPMNSKKDVINNTLILAQSFIIRSRRLYPERKWHKKVERNLAVEELSDLYRDSIQYITDAMVILISLFIFLDKYENFNSLFLKKNQEIFNLKKN